MGNKAWSIVFGVVLLGCAIGFAISPLMGWWMPEGVSSTAKDVDGLFNFILLITTFFFLLTEGILVIFMWKYVSTGPTHSVSIKAEYPRYIRPLSGILHDQHRIEMAWTLIPSVLLLWIAFVQIDTWAQIKYASRNQLNDWKSVQGGKSGRPTQQVAISGRQFEWRIRYPGYARFDKWTNDKIENKSDYDSFGKVPQADDIYTVNELHVWKDQPVVVHLTTRDVIHSFNLPNFRVKQDALPGKMIPVWFIPIKANCKWDNTVSPPRFLDGINPDTGKADPEYVWDIPCAELCGWGHYRMIGRIFVHKDEADFADWLKKAEANNHLRTSDR